MKMIFRYNYNTVILCPVYRQLSVDDKNIQRYKNVLAVFEVFLCSFSFVSCITFFYSLTFASVQLVMLLCSIKLPCDGLAAGVILVFLLCSCCHGSDVQRLLNYSDFETLVGVDLSRNNTSVMLECVCVLGLIQTKDG